MFLGFYKGSICEYGFSILIQFDFMIFDFTLHTQIRSAKQVFTLNVSCQSHAKRLAIIGASGSGKSLTLQILAGLQPLDSGSLNIDGKTYADTARRIHIPPQQREVGLVFQDYALFPHLTVAQNIAFGLHQGGRNPPKSADATTEKWLNRMQLSHLAAHYPHQLSGGQKQRVALARACVRQPRWLLLDEPFAALDTDLRQQMREEVAELQRELDIPMLLITHDHADCEALADEVWQMNQGQLSFQAA